MQRGYWYETSRDPATLEAPEVIGEKAGQRTVAKLGARKIDTGEMPVIYESRAAGALIGHFLNAISGGAQYRRASFLLDARGETVMPDFLDIDEAPHIAAGIASKPFDRNGVSTRDKAIVAKGKLETYLLSAYAARRLELQPTGNAGGPQNIIVRTGEQSLDALVAAQQRALLVTDLMGFGVNSVTGDYSRGAAGFLIEQGAIAHPVEEITIAGNLRDMYRGIVAVASDSEPNTPVRTGSILIDRMAIAGN